MFIPQIAALNKHAAVALDWDATNVSDFDYYAVMMSEDTNQNYVEVARVQMNRYVTDPLTEGRVAYFVVYVVDTSGNRSKVSEEVVVRIK